MIRKFLLELKRAGNPADAAQARHYFKSNEDVRFFGVKAPRVKEIEKVFYQNVRGEWGIAEALQFCELMLERRELEAKSAGMLLLGRYRKDFDPKLIERVESWLAGGLCSNWATTDGLCSLIISPLVERRPELLPRLESWTGSESLWLRRAALVAMTPFARRGKHLDLIYRLAEKSLDFPEDLMHKAVGWLLRDAGKTDPGRLEAFLLSEGPRMPRTAVRYAIEKFPPVKRRSLLEMTRSGD
ncbi:MAG: DNA alkylation repair protein [Blastocatellales bacterium]